ncbi:MAG: HPF/RaiA family ribosome-associated protein [Patescibacteria group bacterium]
MNIRYLFKGVKVDGRTRDYIEKRLKNLEKLLNKLLLIEVEIDMDKKGKFRAEVMAHTPYKKYRTEEISDSIEGAIDVCEEELRNQISRDKDKKETLIKKGGRLIKKRMVLDEKARF